MSKRARVALIATGTAAMAAGVVGLARPPVHGGGAQATKLATNLIVSNCASGFCVSQPTVPGTLYPGAAPQSMPLTITNPYTTPITVKTLTVTFTNAFPTGCGQDAFQVGSVQVPETGTPTVTLTLATPVVVGAATGSVPGVGTYTTTLALLDQGNQNACQNLALAMSYGGTASFTVPTVTTLTSSASSVPAGKSFILTATVAPNVPPAVWGDTPVGSATFSACTDSTCKATTGTPISVALNSSGVATTTVTPTVKGSYYYQATYTPSDSTNFSPSKSGVVTETVNFTYCISSKTTGSLTVTSGQDVCVQSGGSVGSTTTVNSGGRLDVLSGGALNSTVSVATGGALTINGGTVSGGVTSTGASLLTVCGSTLKSYLTISDGTSLSLVGATDGTCAANSISGSVSFSTDTAPLELGGNAISGSVSVTSNTTGTATVPWKGGQITTSALIQSNTIKSGLSCSSNTPAPTEAGLSNTVSGKTSGQCTGTF